MENVSVVCGTTPTEDAQNGRLTMPKIRQAKRYLSAEDVYHALLSNTDIGLQKATAFMNAVPTADVVSKEYADQICWERYKALNQLDAVGLSLGEKTDGVVKVVRCRECKHYREPKKDFASGYCDRFYRATRESFYCADGERRET